MQMRSLAVGAAASFAGAAVGAVVALAMTAPSMPQVPAAPVVSLSPRPTGSPVAEDDPGFNCLTMGDQLCDPSWTPVPRAMYAELDDAVTRRDWRDCLIRHRDTTVIVCTDGGVYTS